jgi:hypothetical protein
MNLTEIEIREVIKGCLLETLRTKSISYGIAGPRGVAGGTTAALLSAIAVTAEDIESPGVISINRIGGLHPDAQQDFKNFKSALEEKGYSNFTITSGTRSLKKQLDLKSTESGPVGDVARSYHNYGYALDINIDTPDGASLRKGDGNDVEWAKVAAIASEHSIKWPLGMGDSVHFVWDPAPAMDTLYGEFTAACNQHGSPDDLWGGNPVCNMPWEVIAGTSTEVDVGDTGDEDTDTDVEDEDEEEEEEEEPLELRCPGIKYAMPDLLGGGAGGCREAGYTHDPVGNPLNESVDLLRRVIRETIAARSFAQLDTYDMTPRAPSTKKREREGYAEIPGRSRKLTSSKPMSPERKTAAAAIMTGVGLAMLGNDRDFMMRLLDRLGLNQTQERLKFLGAWAASENTPALNNPLASTWPGTQTASWDEDPGMKTLGGSSTGVKEYSTSELGVRASAEDIINNHPELLELLRDSNLTAIDYSLGYDFSSWTDIPDTDRYIFRSLEAGDISRDSGGTRDTISFMEEEEIEPEIPIETQKEDF